MHLVGFIVRRKIDQLQKYVINEDESVEQRK